MPFQEDAILSYLNTKRNKKDCPMVCYEVQICREEGI